MGTVGLRGLRKGANAPINGSSCTVLVGSSGVDVLTFQLGSDDRVRSDADVVFYNQPNSPEGAVRLTGPGAVTVVLDLVPASVATVAIAVAAADSSMTTGLPQDIDITLTTEVEGFRWAATGLTTETAAILAEVYRHNGMWKLRNVSAGWEQGLPALFTHFGVAVDDGSAPVPQTPADPVVRLASGRDARSRAIPSSPPAPLDTPIPSGPAVPIPASKRRSAKKRIAWAAAVLVAILVVAGVLGRKPDSSQNTAQSTPAAAPMTTPSTSTRPSPVSSTAQSTVQSRRTALTAAPLLAAPPAISLISTVPAAQAAVTTLEKLRVAGRAPKTGYSRAQFGQAWTDDTAVDGGHNGCDTRNDILRRDLGQLTLRAGSNGCVVSAGTFTDPYTGKMLAFSSSSAAAVQIDHVVALSNAWQTGAAALSPQGRQDLANDPVNLQATAGAVNQAKGDGDAATWLPANKSYRCTYVARQVAVKAKYRLWVTTAERQAISTVLTGCGATAATALPTPTPTPTPTPITKPRPTPPLAPAPTSTRPRATLAAVVPAPAPKPTMTAVVSITPASGPTTVEQPPAVTTTTESSTQESTPAATTPDDSGTYYKNCAAAKAAGAAPLRRGEPGYRAELDRDDDGIACEN